MNAEQRAFVETFPDGDLTPAGTVRMQMGLLARRFYYPPHSNADYWLLCRAVDGTDFERLKDNPEAQQALLMQLRLEGRI